MIVLVVPVNNFFDCLPGAFFEMRTGTRRERLKYTKTVAHRCMHWKIVQLTFIPFPLLSKMENKYANNIPALPPLAAGVDDGPAPAIAQGEPLAFQDVTAAHRQHRNRKRLAKNDPALVTGDELVASKRRKHTVQSSNFDGPTPAWAQQMQATQREMQASQREIIDTLQMVTRRQNEEAQRGMNRSRRHPTDHIVPLVRLLDGDEPNADRHGLWFPQNQVQLLDATGPHLTALLEFYNLDVRGVRGDKKNRLMAHLGVSAA